MLNKKEIMLAGTGGQGLVSTSIMLGEIGTENGFQVTQKGNYGVTTIGGYVQADVVISDEPVIYPEVQTPDIALALTQEAFDEIVKRASDETLVIYDADEINCNKSGENYRGYNISKTAQNVNNARGVNMVGLGILIGLTKIFTLEQVSEHIKGQNYREEIIEKNLVAFNAGYSLTNP